MVKKIYTARIHKPAKLAFNTLKKADAAVLQSMFQHNSAVVGSSGANQPVMGSILRKLFLNAVNIELNKAVWNLETTLDQVYQPFVSKQQVLLD